MVNHTKRQKINRMRKRVTLATWALKFPLESECEKVSNTPSHTCNAGLLSILKPASNGTSFQIRHCCERLLCGSCKSKKLEQMCVIKIRTILRLNLILNLVHLRQKMRLETIQVCNSQSCVQQRSLVCNVSRGGKNLETPDEEGERCWLKKSRATRWGRRIDSRPAFHYLAEDDEGQQASEGLNHLVSPNAGGAQWTWKKVTVVVDSGAAENVMPRSMFPEIGIRQTERSKNGKGFKRTRRREHQELWTASHVRQDP